VAVASTRRQHAQTGVRLFLHQLKAEQRLYRRSHELALFTFLFPVLIFVLLGSVYGSDKIKSEHNIKGSAYLLAGILGYGLASTAFAGLAIILVLRREGGILKRRRATPLPSPTYLASVIAATVVVYAIEAAVLIVLGKVMFHVHFPKQWLSLVLALLLGTLAFAALGIALAGYIRTGDGSSAVVNAIYLPTSFPGSFWSPHGYPRFLEVIADILPLTYFIRLMRDVVLRNEDTLGELGERRGRRRMGSRGSRPGRPQFSLGAERG
jgi:ABC-2 type transport system permease protein